MFTKADIRQFHQTTIRDISRSRPKAAPVTSSFRTRAIRPLAGMTGSESLPRASFRSEVRDPNIRRVWHF